MLKRVSKLHFVVVGVFLLALVYSCKTDDENYVPLEIRTQPDSAEVSQNRFVTINVFANDTNIPIRGSLTTGEARHGFVSILDENGTPQNPSDDILKYEPTANFIGEDTFTYTICSEEGDACATETVTIAVLSASTIVFNLSEMPYPKLSDYNFFEGDMANQEPNFGVLPYAPISTLFTDYAKKKRFIWMPNNAAATYDTDHTILDFPVGTILIKGFYYDNVQPGNVRENIETRLMIKKEAGWIFADYVWNEDQTEAFFDLSGSFTDITWNQNGTNRDVQYRIPAVSQCFTCHEIAEIPVPIGLKPQNLNGNYSYEEGDKNQLQKLIEMGYLEDALPDNIVTVKDWKNTSESLTDRVRSYADINCAHCHSEDRYCHYRPMRFQFDLSEDITNLGVCVDPDTGINGITKIVEPGNIDNSVVYFRLNTELEQFRMPLLGRTIIHDEHVQLVEAWINSLENECE